MITLNDFKKDLSQTPPMQFDQKREKTGFYYFKMLGEKLKESIASDSSPFLPDNNNLIDLKPAYDIYNNTKFSSLTQIMLLTKQAELKASSAGFVSYEIIQKAQKDGVPCDVKKGSKGLVIPVVDNKDWSKIIYKNTWYNISQVENSEALIDYCKDVMTEKYVQNINYNNSNYPLSQFKKQKNPATFSFDRPNMGIMSLNFRTKEPYQYLAQVFYAIDSGKKLLVKPEQASEFKDKALALLSAEYKPGNLDVCAVKKLANSAYRFYKDNRRKNRENVQVAKTKRPVIRKYQYNRER